LHHLLFCDATKIAWWINKFRQAPGGDPPAGNVPKV
jgi:hypothetical protein